MKEKRTTCLPSDVNGLFIVGAAKSGTTALHGLVSQHPQVASGREKEPEYYADATKLNRGLGWYLNLFGDEVRSDPSIILDASVAYTQHPFRLDSAPLIKRDFPNARIVYLVRDPVERWISDYGHLMRQGVYATPEEVFETEPRLLAVSSYAHQVKRYIDVFGEEHVLIIPLSDLSRDPDSVAQRVFAHAGLSPFIVSTMDQEKNVGSVDHYIRHRTTSKVFAFRGGQRLRQMLPGAVKGRAFGLVRSSAIGRKLANSWPEPVFSEELRTRLRESLTSDMDEFRTMTGIDFGGDNGV
jgi:hypothetical protein